PSGLQENQRRLPGTEHRASACSTKERGIRATSSSRTPARVTPWIRAAELSSLPPKRWKVFSRFPKETVIRFWLSFSVHRKPSCRRAGRRERMRLRRREITVLPHTPKAQPWKRAMAQQKKERPVHNVFPE